MRMGAMADGIITIMSTIMTVTMMINPGQVEHGRVPS
jgi:hypothetical protein